MDDNPLVQVGLPVGAFVIMVGIGLTLTLADFRREARAPVGVLVGTFAQLLLMPALAFAIAWALRLPPAIAVGLVIIGACPGGTTSSFITYLGRGNVALSIVLTVVASVATIVTLPIAADLALGWQPAASGVAVRVPVLRTITLLLAVVLVPVAIGMVIRRRWPGLAARIEHFVALFGGVVLVVIVGSIIISMAHEIWTLLAQAGPAASLLNVGGILVGFVAAAAAGLDHADRLTTAIELGVKNSTIGILIAVTVIGSERIAVAPAAYGLLMYLSGFALVACGRRVLPLPSGEQPSATPG